LLFVLPMAALIAGCSSSSTSIGAAGSSTSSFPVTVSAANGNVTIPARPTRIMSLSATATTMLYAIGAGKQVVAVDKYSTYPAHTPVTPLTGFETGPESYVPYHPDLVVLAQDQAGTLAGQLAGLGITTLILPAANTLADTYAQITVLGKATGHAGAAATENAAINAQLASIVHSVGTRARGQTYYQELDPTLYTATSKTFIGELYGSLGMKNIADAALSSGNNYPQLSPEALIQSSPDFVFLADGDCCAQSATTFAARPGYATIGAVRHHHIYVIPDSIASQWGPRVVTFLRMVADDVTGSTSATGS
jgi:iron complex transport system substrate-binding protein